MTSRSKKSFLTGFLGQALLLSRLFLWWTQPMTAPRAIENNRFRGMMYGYLWWIIDPEKRIYAAIGDSGNVIYVNAPQRIVIAVASSFKPAIYDRADFIWEHIEPFVLEQREKIDAKKGKYRRFYKKCVDNAVSFRYNNRADLRDSTMARWSSG